MMAYAEWIQLKYALFLKAAVKWLYISFTKINDIVKND